MQLHLNFEGIATEWPARLDQPVLCVSNAKPFFESTPTCFDARLSHGLQRPGLGNGILCQQHRRCPEMKKRRTVQSQPLRFHVE